MVKDQTPKSGFWGHIPTIRYPWVPWGNRIVFRNDQGQMRVRSDNVFGQNLDKLDVFSTKLDQNSKKGSKTSTIHSSDF